MDPLIKRFDSLKDGDLRIAEHRGIAYQRDMSQLVPYDESYFNKCLSYEDQEIALKINEGRIRLVGDHIGNRKMLDVGIGSGEFIKKRSQNADTYGTDVNPVAIKWLKSKDLYRPDYSTFTAFSFWDVIEHMPDPSVAFRQIPAGSYLFTSIPIFDDLKKIRESKHYRPGEHLYYFTKQGFVDYMNIHGFRLLQMDDFEMEAGRENIYSFAFIKDIPDYHGTIQQYKDLHAGFYGSSSMLHFDSISRIVKKINPKSILDYGCGRSDLASWFWLDGQRKIERYDPAIPQYKVMPQEMFDLVFCNDVMEHINMRDVDKVLAEIKNLGERVIFTISMKPARAKLPDGRNAHVTLLNSREWKRWIGEYFRKVSEHKTEWDHMLFLTTFEVSI